MHIRADCIQFTLVAHSAQHCRPYVHQVIDIKLEYGKVPDLMGDTHDDQVDLLPQSIPPGEYRFPLGLFLGTYRPLIFFLYVISF